MRAVSVKSRVQKLMSGHGWLFKADTNAVFVTGNILTSESRVFCLYISRMGEIFSDGVKEKKKKK